MADLQKTTFHYVKSPSYSELPVHGVYGGVTANGRISMVIYSERMPIPQRIVSDLVPSPNVPGGFNIVNESAEGKEGIVRCVHSTLYIDLDLAKSLVNWLNDKIEAVEAGEANV
jgi:hypothetical protein